MNDVVIIGGGVAGLSAAIHLAERGVQPILIEAGTYPAHKICGEFLSPETLPILARWNINPPVAVKSVTFHALSKHYTFSLPQPAGSMSRYELDARLAIYAQEHGVTVMTGTMVTGLRIHKNQAYSVTLSTGQEIAAKALIIGTGRALSLIENNNNPVMQPMPTRYKGFKAHIAYHDLGDRVLFFSFPGIYLGLSSVGQGVINVACLAVINQTTRETPEAFMQQLAHQSNNRYFQELLTHGNRNFPEWMTVSVPEFGIKKTPNLPNIYAIGDASGTIPPASGDGLGIAITSGAMVAAYVLKNDAAGFKQAWIKRYKPIFNAGIMLHHIMKQPRLVSLTMVTCTYFPRLAYTFFTKTRTNLQSR